METTVANRAWRWLLVAALVSPVAAVSLPTADVAAQAACHTDLEPNDDLEQASTVAMPGCIEGSLPTEEQDLFLWTVTDADALQPWTFDLDGPSRTLTGMRLVPIISDPGESPIRAGSPMLSIDHAPDDIGPVSVGDVLLPAGRYILGVTRSGTDDGSDVTDPAYRVEVRPGTPLPGSIEQEPNDDPETATDIADLFSLGGDLDGSYDHYRWTVTEATAGTRMELRAAGPLGRGLTVELRRPDGTLLRTIDGFDADPGGVMSIPDLALGAGEYLVRVSPASDGPFPYRLDVVPSDTLDVDPEPNDDPGLATLLDPAHPVVRGRLAGSDARDRYLLTVDDPLADQLLDVRVLWRDGPPRELCLEDLDGNAIQCRSGEQGASLPGLRLDPGRYLLDVSGDPAAGSHYLLRVDPVGAARGDFEAEPNDDTDRATPMTVTSAMSGRSDASDDDVFRVRVTGDPQLWQLEVVGTGLEHVAWVHRDGSELTAAEVSQDRTSATLTDLYLIPGEHWFEVGGLDDSDYQLAFTPLGPPDPDGEREPNDGSIRAQPLPMDAHRVGRLTDHADIDVYRFTLDTADHVRLTLTPPADGAVRMRLESGSLRFVDSSAVEPGTPIVWDGVLQPGDYEAWVLPLTPSTGRYTLALERDDPFTSRADLEPNDTQALAAPLPGSLRVDGAGMPGGDVDWYRLGPLPAGGDLLFTTTGPVTRLAVWDALAAYPAETPDEGRWLVAGLPADVPLWVRVETDTADAYGVAINPGATGLAPVAPPPALVAALTVTATPDVVSAYRSVGQAIPGVVSIANRGPDPLSLAIDTMSSDRRWSAIPEVDTVEVPAGASVDVALDIRVLPDAAADQPVRVSVRARDASGAQVTGSVDVRADRTIEPVGAWQAWMVPDGLLGGLDVASAALGGVPVAPLDPEREAMLHDGVTPSGSGYRGSFDGRPVTFTVDLAGETAIPVGGTVLNPLAGRTSQESVPRGFTLLLSEDGAVWSEVLHGELSPLGVDQPFLLPEPVSARFAQLRVDSTWGGPGSGLTLGEWKVVAVPGAVPDAMPANVADPVRGGHVVWMAPQASFQEDADAMLADTPDERRVLYADARERLRWVVGFQDDREALVDRLEWQDPPGSDPAIRIRRVEVEVSATSPIGPWTTLGTWRLERATDGSVEPFALPEGTWARFLRFTSGPARKGTYQVERPAALRVIEHPTDDRYRSILAEWGYASPAGPRDLLEPPDLTPVVEDDLDDDTPETARSLAPAATARGLVHRGEDVDWYAVAVPEGQRSIDLTVGGTPSVGVALTMIDATGAEVPMTFEDGPDPGTVRYRANVTPGDGYRVRVEQPPFSAVFTFDTSASMGDYLPFVVQALGSYAGGVAPGEEQALIMPFAEGALLKEWTDDPYLLQGAMGAYRSFSGSSDAEKGLLDAARALEGREGARAILLVTDAETSSYGENQRLWQVLDSVRPTVFTVHIGADGKPVEARRFMQDWAMAGGGRYQYAVSHGEMDRAFDRMATWLRRPAEYRLRYETSTEQVPPPTPGTLTVLAPPEADGTTGAVIGPHVAVEIVLDTSGSMLQRFGGERRIDVAKRVLADLVRRDLPAGLPVAMRTFVHERRSCATELAMPLGPLEPEDLASRIEGLSILRSVRTPLAKAIRAVADDLADVTGPRVVIVVSDGAESCGGDPAREVRRLRDAGTDVTLNVVGLALDDSEVRRSIRRLARLGGGSYFDARDPDEVAGAIRTAVSAPFQVFDTTGALVARGTVGGAAIELPPGTYRVVVLTDPEMVYGGVVIDQGGAVTVTLPSAGERPTQPDRPAPSETPAPAGTPAPAP